MIIGYLRVSTKDQSVAAQKQVIQKKYPVEKWYEDQGESGVVKALNRSEFRKMADFVRQGDTVVVVAIDRLGRNTIDVLETVQFLQAKGVAVVSLRESFDLASPLGTVLLAIVSAFAELERGYIKDRQMAGIRNAQAEGKKLGRKVKVASEKIREWRQGQKASISQTARHFNISPSTVKRACAGSKAILKRG